MRTFWARIALSLIIQFAVFVLVLEGTSLLVTANGLRLLRGPKRAL